MHVRRRDETLHGTEKRFYVVLTLRLERGAETGFLLNARVSRDAVCRSRTQLIPCGNVEPDACPEHLVVLGANYILMCAFYSAPHSPSNVPQELLIARAGVGSRAGLGTAPARGADWQSGRRRPGNGSGFSGGRDPPEEAAAAARAARGERRERRAAAAGCLCVPGPAWRLLSGLAGAGREPPGLSVPERCECSPLASKVWSRERQAPVLSSAAAQIRRQLRRHVRAVLRSPARVKPPNLGARFDPRDHSLFGVFLRAHRLLHPDPLRAPAQHRAQRSAAIQVALERKEGQVASATWWLDSGWKGALRGWVAGSYSDGLSLCVLKSKLFEKIGLLQFVDASGNTWDAEVRMEGFSDNEKKCVCECIERLRNGFYPIWV
ncbi:uncharacterized protein LOC116893119 [Rattus rattus]|uniref:uncharacterized protein LOC116893119 n=1 Tax=Rattus rattus TaxID=10117 RepID=UPI0013F360B2|nr:uncharacterized protein LOC116893119 [Rattus rattus]